MKDTCHVNKKLTWIFLLLGVICRFSINIRIEVHLFCLHWEMKGHWSRVNLVERSFPNANKKVSSILKYGPYAHFGYWTLILSQKSIFKSCKEMSKTSQTSWSQEGWCNINHKITISNNFTGQTIIYSMAALDILITDRIYYYITYTKNTIISNRQAAEDELPCTPRWNQKL